MSAPCRIRVLLLGFRPLARRFVADAVQTASDMELVDETAESQSGSASRHQADVIVVRPTGDEAEPMTDRSHPHVLEIFGGTCDLYERRLVRTNVGLDDLVDVIREIAVVPGLG